MDDRKLIGQEETDELEHYGTPRHSGRYPWGSGENPYQRNGNFVSHVTKLRKNGLSEKQIADSMEMTTSQLRAKLSIAKAEIRKEESAMAWKLKEKGYSNVAIGKRMGKNESSVRALLDPHLKERNNMTNELADQLKAAVDEKKYIDVGSGTEHQFAMPVSSTRMRTAIALLEQQGYKIQYVQVDQMGTNNKTSIKVLTKNDVGYKELADNKEKISLPTNFYMEDNGTRARALEPPVSIDSKRVYVNYTNDDGTGGAQKDGLIELRRGVPDISLGNANYAQVRIAVDGNKYMKGMAVYSDDIPDGYDIIYNTNKTRDKSEKVFKKMEKDPVNPFGATIKMDDQLVRAQRHYIDPKTGEEKLSALNIVNEEGNWNEWSKSLSSQVLSKQTYALAKKQLGLAYDAKAEEFKDILATTNPAVKKQLLDSFADDCDAAAVHLKAAALPRQRTQVILPSPDIPEKEIYAPNFHDGESVVLIRFPHAGRFEIPECVVNNSESSAGRKIIGNNPIDPVVINAKTAEKLSGADFDGDSVLVIPNNDGKMKTAPALQGLKNFDPKEAYPKYPGMHIMTDQEKGREMGMITNLITDMSLQNPTPDELARAVRHSMVVIDAKKHELNYQQSYKDNDIAELKIKYQGKAKSGASTLLSKASSTERVPDRKDGIVVKDKETGKKKKIYIDSETGEKLYTETGETYNKPVKNTKTGEVKRDADGKPIYKETPKTLESTKMYETKDAFSLSSGTVMESAYAVHANKLKALANEARKESLSVKPLKYNPSAKQAYAQEVASLNAQLNEALKNAPLERQAQLLANYNFKAKMDANPEYRQDADKVKKIKGQSLTEARLRVGAKKTRIKITPKEWEAIQAGAITHNKLTQILKNADMDVVKSYAMPRNSSVMPAAKIARAKRLSANGYGNDEIAQFLGVSVSTIIRTLNDTLPNS